MQRRKYQVEYGQGLRAPRNQHLALNHHLRVHLPAESLVHYHRARNFNLRWKTGRRGLKTSPDLIPLLHTEAPPPPPSGREV